MPILASCGFATENMAPVTSLNTGDSPIHRVWIEAIQLPLPNSTTVRNVGVFSDPTQLCSIAYCFEQTQDSGATILSLEGKLTRMSELAFRCLLKLFTIKITFIASAIWERTNM